MIMIKTKLVPRWLAWFYRTSGEPSVASFGDYASAKEFAAKLSLAEVTGPHYQRVPS